jgi:hypothetical protein
MAEHRGIQYQIVQTANPTGFRWTVHFEEAKAKTGVSASRKGAVFEAEWAIDKALGHQEPSKAASVGGLFAEDSAGQDAGPSQPR